MVSVFFVDDDQQVTVYDYGTIDHIKQAAYREHSEVIMGDELKLTSEFRCLGGEDYMRFIRGFLGYEKAIPYVLKPHQYDFRVFDYAADMREEIRKRDEEEKQKHLSSGFSLAASGKCRMVSGYIFDWKTKKSKDIRKQIVVRMMPVAVPAIIAGTILALPVVMLFLKMAFGTVFDIRLFWVPIAIVLISLYVYMSTYISAGKVKKISVTELMTE